MTIVAMFQNEGEWIIRGSFDLSAAAAVVANSMRGTNMTPVKTGTGAYTVTLKGVQALRLVERIKLSANYSGGVPATALGVRVATVTQNTDDDIVITLNTTALPTSGANTDGTAATTVNFEVVLRVIKMGNPL